MLGGDFNGQGTYTGANGYKFVGEWKNNQPNGLGIDYAADGTVLKEGTWENGELVQSHQVAE